MAVLKADLAARAGFYEAEAIRYDYEVADNEEEHRDAVD
jgi:hypothetical protein